MSRFFHTIIFIFTITVPFAMAQQQEPQSTELEDAKFLIEHNATDNDTGFQLFVDGEPWNNLIVSGPNGEIITIDAKGNFENFGLTEGFFETNEPAADEVPLEDILAQFPAGDYTYAAKSAADGNLVMRKTATLSHTIPAKPEIQSPEEEEVIQGDTLLISWLPVTQSLNGEPINILGYQVIVVEETEELPEQSFFKNEFNVYVPSAQNSLTVPSEFLRPGLEYEVEVLAIEESGNQTISLRTFSTEGQASDPDSEQ